MFSFIIYCQTVSQAHHIFPSTMVYESSSSSTSSAVDGIVRLFNFKMLAILAGVQSYLIVALLLLSLKINDVEHCFIFQLYV